LSDKTRYDIRWVGHFNKDTSDKIWGWFYFHGSDKLTTEKPYHCYVFWARTGKTPSFKKHVYNRYRIRQLEEKKMQGAYKKISVDELLTLWPTFYEDIEKKFIFHILADDI